MSFALNLPINNLSFGQVSIAMLREIFSRGLLPNIFPIGNVDISTQKQDQVFTQQLQTALNNALSSHQRKTPILKLWHLNGGLESYSDKQVLLSFYELDNPTKEEINIAKNNHKLVLTSEYSKRMFDDVGVGNVEYIPLAFDSFNFRTTNKQYFTDGRIVFNLAGKFEKRKNHEKVIRAWVKKYGNNPKYSLQCAIFNPFLSPEVNQSLIAQILNNQRVDNLTLLGTMPHNELYNDYLNSGDIILAMSGGEGFGLPEFHSVALGKHAVVLNAHAYKCWAKSDNSILVNPSGKQPVYDGVFFAQGAPFNQGNIYDFNPEEFIAGCEKAIKRVEQNRVNEAGLKLQQEFTYAKTVDALLKLF